MTNNWQTVKFGDVVNEIREVERNPLENGIEYYIGLEHLDPESLQIKRWGNIAEDETTFTRKFTAGQLLFGRRRAYQRKAALADFDGICSGDIMVFETKNDKLIPELLPFIVQSDGFFDYAISTSAGSLSPRTKWSHLAKYEFTLPPRDEQRRIAEILWAVEETIRRYEDALDEIYHFKALQINHFVLKGYLDSLLQETKMGQIPSHWDLVTVGDVLDICQYGLSSRANDKAEYPIFRMMNIEDGVIVENDMKYIDLDENEFEKYRLEVGDILFNRTNSAELVGKVGIFRLRGNYVFASYLIRLRVDSSKILPEYLNFYLNSREGQRRILRYATAGVSQSNINAKNLQRVLLPLPPLEEQIEIRDILLAIDTNKNHIAEHISYLSKLKNRLISQLLSDGIAQSYV